MDQYPFPPRNMGRIDRRMVALVALVVVALGLLYSSYYQIEPGEQAVVLRFGKYHRTVFAGPHVKLFWPIEEVMREQVARVRLLEIGYHEYRGEVRPVMAEAMMLTGDKNIVVSPMNVQYTIDSVRDFLFSTRDPERVIHDAAEAALRQVIGAHLIDDALSERRDQIEREIAVKLDELVNGTYHIGIRIGQVQLRDVRVPDQVVEAFRDVTSAKEDSARSIEQAEGYANRVLPRAQADSIRIARTAEAYSQTRVLLARGDSSRFVQLYRQYYSAPQITRTRMYLETMEKVLGRNPKYVIDGDRSTIINVLGGNEALRRTLEGGSR